MPQTLGNNKSILLNQVREIEKTKVNNGGMTKEDFVRELIKCLNTYDDLKMDDYRGYVSDEILNALEDMNRDPNELKLWKEIEAAPENSIGEIEKKLGLVEQYMVDFPQSPKSKDAADIKARLIEKRNKYNAELAWNNLDKQNYEALRSYRQTYPGFHTKDLDDYMWQCTDKSNKDQLNRYLKDWREYNPAGQYVKEAKDLLDAGTILGTPRIENDIFELKKFIDANPSFCQYHPEVKQRYEDLRRNVLCDMKKHPERFSESNLNKYYNAGIFTEAELIVEDIILPQIGSDVILPDLRRHGQDSNSEAEEGCTDIYLFGVPGTGKTCLLMGLAGASGDGYTINMKEKGGDYAADLQQYLFVGKTPGTTPGTFVTTIKCQIDDEIRKNKRTDKIVYANHDVNFVEMSGEEFAHKIANNKEVNFEDMGQGTKELLRNSNRKVFFIIVDPTLDVIPFDYLKKDTDGENNIINQTTTSEQIYQKQCLSKFADLFEAKENKEFMKKVDAIHFIVTKADTLGDSDEERKERARQLLIDKYKDPIDKLVKYCRNSKRVNYATDFRPMVYPFSLGKFYVGGKFKYEDSSTLNIIKAIRLNTAAKKVPNFWDKFRDILA